ncbi:hypothetical protein BCR34DRAFT_553128 [Clohesyomyces aquaticus]|uniref:Oxysterol-binding protein n=1 Tax=Clohesyomyces aquaticus TaxID=1231657 RepID=A0A1Y2A912_9PLEO|nr:hypothetical protein BCR34DRAFT_553128 [Clohesyomyces aquaticus]
MSGSLSDNRSALKEFLASIANIKGDLSNTTAPLFVLAPYSTVELPQYWADHPSLFVAPALEADPEKRALLVLKWFLGSLRNQQYGGRDPQDGVKKPLNAVLGELFLGSWTDDQFGETKLVSEQVSHHPPITACYLRNEKYGIRAEGFTCQEITFSGSVNIKQRGYATLRIDRFDESYLIPVPNIKVKGILSGSVYPELIGSYQIASSSGLVSEIEFEGKGLLTGGTKNGFTARVFDARSSNNLYTAKGSWNSSFSFYDSRTGEEMETYDVGAATSLQISTLDISDQDLWESRKTWAGVIAALNRGDMKAVSEEKLVVEEGQRHMRREEETRGSAWMPLFFRRRSNDAVLEKISTLCKVRPEVDLDMGMWKVDENAVVSASRPFHGELVPTGTVVKEDTGHGGAQDEAIKSNPQSPKGTEKLEKLQIEEFLRSRYSNHS